MDFLKKAFAKGTYFDFQTAFLTLFLALFGVMMIYSASSYTDGTGFAKKQLIFVVLGVVLMIAICRFRYQLLKKFVWAMVIVESILLIAVMVAGKEVYGAARWLKIGPIGFQPSELAKYVVIIYMAAILQDKSSYLKTFVGTLKLFAAPVFLCGLVILSDLSTAAVMIAIVGVTWIVATPRLRYLPIFIIAAVVVAFLFIKVKVGSNESGYREGRIDAWLHVETSDYARQTREAMYAIGTGGVFGRGLGQGIQKMGKIPMPQNDMIFAIVCEELGLVGGIGLLIIYLLLIYRLTFIAFGAPDRFGSFIAVGVIAHIAVQVWINVAVVTNTVPNTGIPLPFISYGGSSLLFLFLEIGTVLSVSRQIEPESVARQKQKELEFKLTHRRHSRR